MRVEFDDGAIELELSDANLPPGESSGQQLNPVFVWERFPGEDWVSTCFKSLMACRDHYARHTSLEECKGDRLSAGMGLAEVKAKLASLEEEIAALQTMILESEPVKRMHRLRDERMEWVWTGFRLEHGDGRLKG